MKLFWFIVPLICLANAHVSIKEGSIQQLASSFQGRNVNLAGSASTSMAMGTEFVYSYLSNHVDETSNENLWLTITNPTNQTAIVTITSQFEGFNTISKTVKPYMSIPARIFPTNIQTDYDGILNSNFSIDNRSIFVKSTVPIKLIATNQVVNDFSEDKFSILPICELGTSYIVVADESSNYKMTPQNIFSVIATEDNTNLTITGITSVPQILNKGQVFTYSSIRALSGFTIVATKKVAVITGSVCGYGISNKVICSHQATMVYPLADWALNYPHYKFNYETNSEVLVFIQQNDTTITINGEQVNKVYSSDEYITLQSSSGIFVTGDKPIYAVVVGTVNSNDYGAPFLANLVSSSQFTSNPIIFAIGMNSDEGLNLKHFARIVTKINSIGNIAIDSYIPNGLLYRRMGKSDYYFIDVPIVSGQHKIAGVHGSETYGSIVYAYGDRRSYAFNPGLNLISEGNC